MQRGGGAGYQLIIKTLVGGVSAGCQVINKTLLV